MVDGQGMMLQEGGLGVDARRVGDRMGGHPLRLSLFQNRDREGAAPLWCGRFVVCPSLASFLHQASCWAG